MLTIWPMLIVPCICMKNKSRPNSQSLVTTWLLVASVVVHVAAMVVSGVSGSPLCSTGLHENLKEVGFAKITFSSFFQCEIFDVFVYSVS